MQKKLLLLNPMPNASGITQRKGYGNCPPLNLAYVAALTPADWTVQIIDESIQEYCDEEADLVGLTALTHSAPRAYALAQGLRRRGIPTVIGGVHASMLPDEAASYVDTVVIGEAEGIWERVIEDFESGRMRPRYQGEWRPLENLPVPRRDLFSKRYTFRNHMQTARGCPMRCDFCSVSAFNGGKYRRRPVEEVLAELETFDSKLVFFVDDNILGYGRDANSQALELFRGIVERGLKIRWFSHCSLNITQSEEVLEAARKSGCFNLFVGFESLNDEALRRMRKVPNVRAGAESYSELIKRFHDHGIGVSGGFIFGDDLDTPDVFEQTADFILRSKLDAAQLTILNPLPGTALFERLRSEGRLLYTSFPEDWERYDNLGNVLFKPKNMTPDELLRGVLEVYKATTAEPRSILRALVSLYRTRSPWSAAAGYLWNHVLGTEFIKKYERDAKHKAMMQQ